MNKENFFTRVYYSGLNNRFHLLVLFSVFIVLPNLLLAQALVFPGIDFDDSPEHVERIMKQNQTLIKDSEKLIENFIFLTYKEGKTLYTFSFDDKKLDSISKDYSASGSFKEEFSLLKDKLGYPTYYDETKGVAEWSTSSTKTTLRYNKKYKSFLLNEEGGEFKRYAWSLN